MRNVSQQFKDKLLNGDYNYLATAEITLEDNTTLTLTNAELWTGGFSIDDAVSEDNSFTALGSTIINASKIIINNIDETYSIYDFHNATVILKVAKNLIIDDSSVTESIRLGTFRVDDVSYNGTTITLALLDYMEQFDRPYSLSNLAYPATLDQIVRDACNCCGVYLNTYDFPHKNYTVSSKPDSDSVTFREVIGWAAAIAGCFARCNVYGQLELKWFDIDNLINQTSGTYHDISSIFSQEISLDDTVITGVVITVSGERNEETQYSSGTEGYTINIKGNEFITVNQAQAVANWLGQAVIGMQFRKLNITHLNDPSIEAGDIAVVTDRKGNTYPTLVTRTNFAVGNTQTTVCGSETPSRNSATRYSSATKSFVKARKMLRQESTARDLQYEQLNERLDEHTGLYSTQESTQSGTIYYFHDMPDLQDSTVIWKMTSEAWGVSTDGGQTWNAGMTVDGDALVRILSVTGINADWINAGTLEIKDTNGNVIFQASKDSHSVFISGNVQMTGSQTLSGAISSAENNANSYTDNAVSDYAETVTAKFTEIEGRIDGQIETWFYDYAPTLNNVPASNWTTEETKDVHKGDLFIDTSSGNSYRFLKENGTWTWKLISDSTATAALQAAARAQDTADHKRRVFYTTPTPPYDQGDLWVQGENGDILRCAQQRAEGGSYVATDWVKASKYTDDSAFETFVNNDYNTTIANLWKQLDGKSETFYQDTDPSLEWTTVGVPWLDHTGDAFLDHEENEIYLAYAEMANAHEGDLWHNTTDNTEWIWQNGEWKPMSIPDEVFDTLDGKAQIFGVQPYTPYHVSDLWFTGDEILYCQTERLTGDFNAADWTKKEGYTDDSSLTTFVNATYIPQMELFSNQLDEKIQTWYQDTDPSTEWNQIEEDYWLDSEGEAILDQDGNEFTLLYTPTQLLHNGDFWHNTSDNTEYIYKEGEWQQLDVPDEFFDLVDGKAVIFTSEPTVPYNENDLWFTGEAILVSTQTRTTGTFVASDWIKKDYYTDDSALLNWISTDFANTIQELQEQTDQKAETWYQSTDPSVQWTTAELKQLHTGDLWYNTANGANTTWFWDGTRWVQQNIPSAVFDEIDGKAQIFVNQPTTPYSIGDLWFDSATSDIMTCIVSRTSGNYNANDWQKRNKYTDDTELNNFVNTTYQNQIENFQNQIDNKVETFYQATDPQEQWATTESDVWVDSTGDNILDSNGQPFTLLFTPENAKHEGDLWHNTSDNTEWMYKQGIWQPMEISDELFDMIDGRATVFTSTPVVPYNKDDMWFTGTEILVSNTTRKTGSFKQSDWIKKDYYTDDSAFQTWKAEDYTETIEDFQVQMDGKIETWNQDTDPSVTWTSSVKTKHAGDIWYNPTDKITKRYSGSTWVTIEDSQAIAAQELASVKRRIFTTTPVPPYDKGDLWWTSTTDGSAEIKMSKSTRTSGVYVADDWILSRYVDGDDVQTAITTYDSSLGQTEVFNKLTNGGDVQGIYIQDGKVYINATYIMSGTLAGERINGRNIHVIDENNNSTFYIDADGNVQINASALSIVGKNIREYVSSSVNLLEDPYGLSTTYWSSAGTVTREQRDPMGGTNAIKLTATTSNSRFLTNQNTNKPLKSKNTTYRFSVWLKASSTIENFQLSINYTSHVEKITVTTEWKLYTINYEVGDTISSASHVIIGGGNSFSSGDIYIYYPSVQYTDLYMSQALIMDRLTNGGTEQGLYLSDNKVYINGEYIKAKSISANEIKDSTITGGKIANATIVDGNILAGTITGAKLANSTITGAKIASTTIEASNIKDATITGAKIANGTITGTQIQASTITGAKIASTTIEASNIKDGTITGAKIASATISGSNIQSATITGAKIASTTIEASNIKDGTITGTKIANATIAGSNIQSATITGSKISTGTIENTNIKDGTITGAKIASATITSAKIAGGTITAAEIKDGAITGAKISDGTITNTKISDGTITGAKISSGTITGAEIANSTITSGKIDVSDLRSLNATIGGFTITSNSIQSNKSTNYDQLTLSKTSSGGRIRAYDSYGEFYLELSGNSLKSSASTLALRLVPDAALVSQTLGGDEHNLGQTTFYGNIQTGANVDLIVKGSKSAVRQTEHYGEQTYYCYETPCEMFGDIGDGVLDETGTCIVEIDDIMTEACNTQIQYYVFLQKCGEGDCWVDDRQSGYFIVKGTPGMTFSWELKAKQTGREYIRYNDDGKEINNAGFKMPNYAQQFTNELDSIIERLED